MPDRRKLHEGLRRPRTQSTEREEAWQRPQPVLVTMGLMLHLRSPYNHSPTRPRHSLTCTYVYVYYYLPREKITMLSYVRIPETLSTKPFVTSPLAFRIWEKSNAKTKRNRAVSLRMRRPQIHRHRCFANELRNFISRESFFSFFFLQGV